jgi:hypothetical protein
MNMSETPSALDEAQNLAKSLEDAVKAMEAALLCLDEGNVSRAGQILYSAIKAAAPLQ